MNEITRVAIDTSKSVFTLHAVDARDQPVLRRNLRRQDLVPFFAKLPPVTVSMEACGGSHYWGRTLQALGHRVRLIPAQYVKPFVKRSKNDRNDAQAISEAAARPGMQEVAVKSADVQARAMLLTVRELLVRQRTQLVNALRGHATEMGLVAPVGGKGLAMLRSEIEADATLPEAATEALRLLGREVHQLEARLAAIDKNLLAQHKADPDSRRLSAIPGVGPMSALSFSRMVDATQFESERRSRPGWAWCRARSQPAASNASAASAAPVTSGCVSCWCLAPPPSFALPGRGVPAYRHGYSLCWSASRASSRLSLWPTRWPGLSGPC